MPIELLAENGTWWLIKGRAQPLYFNVTGWSLGVGYWGDLHIGTPYSGNPLRICINDRVFEHQLEGGEVEQITEEFEEVEEAEEN